MRMALQSPRRPTILRIVCGALFNLPALPIDPWLVQHDERCLTLGWAATPGLPPQAVQLQLDDQHGLLAAAAPDWTERSVTLCLPQQLPAEPLTVRLTSTYRWYGRVILHHACWQICHSPR